MGESLKFFKKFGLYGILFDIVIVRKNFDNVVLKVL